MQGAYCDRFHAVIDQALDGLASAFFIQRLKDRTIAVDSLVHFAALPAWNERLGKIALDVVHIDPVTAPNVENVSEPLRNQQTGLSSATLQQRVNAERGSVDYLLSRRNGLTLLNGMSVDSSQDRLGRIVWGCKELASSYRPIGCVDKDEVCEGTADITSNPLCHVSCLR